MSYLGAVLGASWSLLACLARFLRLSCAIPIDLGRISAALGSILDDLGSILLDLASIWCPSGDRFLYFLHALLLERARSLEEEANFEKPANPR